jgi:3-oxoacyl-[acyl-carrier protein] reductase
MMRFDYSDRVVLVTGGSQGIGHGVASAFADAGAEVHITGTRAAPTDYAGDLSRFVYHQVRMENPDERARLAAEFGPLDILVNNAGTAGDNEYELAGYAR